MKNAKASLLGAENDQVCLLKLFPWIIHALTVEQNEIMRKIYKNLS